VKKGMEFENIGNNKFEKINLGKDFHNHELLLSILVLTSVNTMLIVFLVIGSSLIVKGIIRIYRKIDDDDDDDDDRKKKN
jgi:hypothetical protein